MDTEGRGRELRTSRTEAVPSPAPKPPEPAVETIVLTPSAPASSAPLHTERSIYLTPLLEPSPAHSPTETPHSDTADIPPNQALEAALQEADPTQLVPDTASSPIDQIDRSPEYSPTLDRAMADVPDDVSDHYEPPEAAPPAEGMPITDSPPFSPAPPPPVSEVMKNSHTLRAVPSSAPQIVPRIVGETVVEQNGQPLQPRKDAGEHPNGAQLFTPYQSPLKNFRAFRFHPDFKQEIKGGLKSMTYSHKIDPKKELCRYELAGGKCNDPTCDLQHFRDIGLPDDAVLTALGSPDEFTGEKREKFVAGLKEVLTDLRLRKVRDFDVIASEIVAHRAKFLGDRSKVLKLEGTTI